MVKEKKIITSIRIKPSKLKFAKEHKINISKLVDNGIQREITSSKLINLEKNK